MVSTPDRLVIRTYAPLRRHLILSGSVVLVAVLLWLAYQWGRGGVDPAGQAAAAERARLTGRLRQVEAENRELRLKLAAQESARIAQGREREEVMRSISELQGQLARQAQDLAFYRGIAGDTAAAMPVRVQQFRVAPLETPRHFQLRLVLGRPVRPEDVVSGTLSLTIEGSQGGRPATLDLAGVTQPPLRELRFSYRYLQSLEQEVVLPEAFQAARVTAEIRLARKDADPVRQTFLWNADGS